MTERRSIGREAAIHLGESGWWRDRPVADVVEFQLLTVELAMPFHEFHRLTQEALGRDVWTHEFADCSRLLAELRGEREPATFDDVMALIPVDKLVVVEVTR